MSFRPREIKLAKGDIYENVYEIHVEHGFFEPHHNFYIFGWDFSKIVLKSVEGIDPVTDSWGGLDTVDVLEIDWDDFSKFVIVKRLNEDKP